jgi:hypothetical protein
MPSDFLVIPDDDGTSPRDPDAACDRCGRHGTAVRVTRHLAPPVITQFCSSCWREVRDDISPPVPLARPSPAEAVAFLTRTEGPPMTIVSRSWDDTLTFIGLLTHAPRDAASQPPWELEKYRAEIAAEIIAGASAMDGPMPSDVQAFVDKHYRPGS